MIARPEFLFVTCQVGAEGALKAEVGQNWPDFRFSFSRPGFVTFKLPSGHNLVADFDFRSTFAQAYGFSLGRTSGESLNSRAAEAWSIWGSRPVRAVHVWQRELYAMDHERTELRVDQEAMAARRAILDCCPHDGMEKCPPEEGGSAVRGDFVFDCILVEPDQWWIGYHRAKGVCSRVPGGLLGVTPSVPTVSRAWYKIEEALAWSGLPIPPESRFADLGCAPGGTSQALLQRGHWVTGIDPAEVSAEIRESPRFCHIRRRTTQVKRREFRKIRWLTADMNVAPEYTLEAVESIVTHPEVRIRGIVLTLKLLEWKLAARIPDYIRRVRGWGFNQVRTRQLCHHRQEFCLVGLKKPFKRH